MYTGVNTRPAGKARRLLKAGFFRSPAIWMENCKSTDDPRSWEKRF